MVEKVFLYLYVLSLPLIGLGVFKACWGLELGVGIIPAYIIAIALGYILLVKSLYLADKKHGITVIPSAVNGVLLLFFTVLAASSVMSFFVPDSEFRGEILFLKSLKQIAFWGFMIFNYFILILTIRDIKRFKMVLTVHIMTSFFVSIFGILQILNSILNIPWINTINEYFSTSESMLSSISNLSFADYISNLGRVRSTTPEPLVFANYLLTAIPFIFANMIAKKKFLLIPNWFNIVILITTTTTFILTFSKGGYLALIMGFSIMLATTWHYGNIRKILKYLFIVIALIPVIYYLIIVQYMEIEEGPILFLDNIIQMREIFSGGSSSENLSVLTKWFSMIAALKMFLYYPVLGVGIGNYIYYYYDFAPFGGEIAQFDLPTANNIFLQIFSETGILGGGLFLLVIWFHVRKIKVIPRNITQARSIRWAFIFSGSAVLVQLLSVSAYTWPHLWFLMALIATYKDILHNEMDEKSFGSPVSREFS